MCDCGAIGHATLFAPHRARAVRRQALRENRSRPRGAGLKVLFMSGSWRDANAHTGRLDAGIELIEKPITKNRIVSRIRKLLDRQQKPQ